MVSELETKLARSLALAVGHEAQKSIEQGIIEYKFPDWYAEALDVLASYRSAAYDQKAQEQRHEQY